MYGKRRCIKLIIRKDWSLTFRNENDLICFSVYDTILGRAFEPCLLHPFSDLGSLIQWDISLHLSPSSLSPWGLMYSVLTLNLPMWMRIVFDYSP